MHKRKGWDPFWAALLASLLVLVPLVGGTVLLSHRQLRTQLRQAARSESGIPVQLPKTTDRLTVLLCVSGEQPGFLLAYLNASQNAFHLLSIPAELTVSFAGEAAPLTRCYTAAGPARCREALAQVLPLPEDTRYLALSPAVLERTLEFLANNTAAVEAQTLPGDWDAVGGTYTLNEASLAAVQAFFNASPTDAQASSASEP